VFTSSYSVGLFDIVPRVIISVKYASIMQNARAQAKKRLPIQRTSSWRLQVHCFILHILHLTNVFLWVFDLPFTVRMLIARYCKTQNLYFSTSSLKARPCGKHSWWNCSQIRIHRDAVFRLKAEVWNYDIRSSNPHDIRRSLPIRL